MFTPVVVDLLNTNLQTILLQHLQVGNKEFNLLDVRGGCAQRARSLLLGLYKRQTILDSRLPLQEKRSFLI